MTTKSLGKIGRSALLMSPVVIAVVSFFALLIWLKPHNQRSFVLVLSLPFSIFVMGYTSFLARRVQRRLDEVQIASQGFASFRGFTWGAGITVFLLTLPPVSNGLIDLTDVMAAGAPNVTTRHRTAVLLGLVFGSMLLILIQAVCMIVASAIWQRRMGGTREP